MKNRAFTLIELLVVVLIIGILTAIALSRYQKIVEKTKATQALTVLKTVMQAEEDYYLANGNSSLSFDNLAVGIPFTGRDRFIYSSAQDTSRSNDEWIFQLEEYLNHYMLHGVRKNGKYKGAGFRITLSAPGGTPTKQIECFERKTGALVLFDSSLAEGAYCQQIMGGTLRVADDYARYYTL